MNGSLYTVLAVNGDFADAIIPETDSLRYDGLSWDEAVELCRLSFMQGYECVIWRMEMGECAET